MEKSAFEDGIIAPDGLSPKESRVSNHPLPRGQDKEVSAGAISAQAIFPESPVQPIHPQELPSEARSSSRQKILSLCQRTQKLLLFISLSGITSSYFLLSVAQTASTGLLLLLFISTLLLGFLLSTMLYQQDLACLLVQLQKLRSREEEQFREPKNRKRDLLSQLALEVQLLERMLNGLKLERDTIYARHELITTNIAASVIIRDVSGKILFCSPYTQVLTGYSLEEIYDAADDFIEHIVLEEDRSRYQRAQKVSALAEDISVKYRILHKSGLKLWLETRLVPVLDEDGELISIMSVTLDVTDTLSYQKQIEEQNQDLSDFAYMVSHDLKAPIFTIKGMASAVLEDHGEALGKSGIELVEYIVDATKRLERLVASVIEYSALSKKEAQLTQVNLNQVLDNVKADLQELIKQKKASLTVEPNLPTIQGNPIRVYQIFSNLLGNALKYSSPERTPEISITRRKISGSGITIDIADNGLGVPEKKLGDIFRPYHRAHGNQVEGSGIGLACVKKIIEQLGGSVSVQSVENQGSVFTITFPPPPPKPREIPQDLMRCFDQ